MPTTSASAGRSTGGVSSVRRLLRSAVRRAERRFLVEGPQAVLAAAAAGLLTELYATAEAAERLPGLDVPMTIVGDRALASLTETVTPQGVVGVADCLDVPVAEALSGSPRLVAILHDVRDPGNVGTIIRTADAAGADAVVLTGDGVDLHNGKVVRSSAGSVFHLPIAVAGWAQTRALCMAGGLQVWATSGASGDDPDGPDDPSDAVAWTFGNEAHGLPAEVLGDVDRVVRIPIYGRAESLNVASAAAVCLYASARTQRTADTGH